MKPDPSASGCHAQTHYIPPPFPPPGIASWLVPNLHLAADLRCRASTCNRPSAREVTRCHGTFLLTARAQPALPPQWRSPLRIGKAGNGHWADEQKSSASFRCLPPLPFPIPPRPQSQTRLQPHLHAVMASRDDTAPDFGYLALPLEAQAVLQHFGDYGGEAVSPPPPPPPPPPPFFFCLFFFFFLFFLFWFCGCMCACMCVFMCVFMCECLLSGM